MESLGISNAVIKRRSNLLIDDYYLYFIMICFPCNKVMRGNWCKVSTTFIQYLRRVDFTIEDDFAYFDYDFGDSIDEISNYLLSEVDDDVLYIVFKFIWSIAVENQVNIPCRYGMESFWLGLGARMNYKIKIVSNYVQFLCD